MAVLTLAFAPVTRASPRVRLGPQRRPHVAHPGRAAREPREQRPSYAPQLEGMKLSRFDRVLGLARERLRRIYCGEPGGSA